MLVIYYDIVTIDSNNTLIYDNFVEIENDNKIIDKKNAHFKEDK